MRQTSLSCFSSFSLKDEFKDNEKEENARESSLIPSNIAALFAGKSPQRYSLENTSECFVCSLDGQQLAWQGGIRIFVLQSQTLYGNVYCLIGIWRGRYNERRKSVTMIQNEDDGVRSRESTTWETSSGSTIRWPSILLLMFKVTEKGQTLTTEINYKRICFSRTRKFTDSFECFCRHFVIRISKASFLALSDYHLAAFGFEGSLFVQSFSLTRYPFVVNNSWFDIV